MTTRINFKGKQYDSPEEMPRAVREAYERTISMLQEGSAGGATGPKGNIKVATSIRFVHKGKVYNDLDKMPSGVASSTACAAADRKRS